jgi:hypothetical protein
MGRLLLLLPFVALLLAAPAHASDQDYLANLENRPGIIGGPVNEAVYLAAGHHACDLIGSGTSPEDAAGQLVNFFVTPYIAHAMVDAARVSLCP